jgi:hypothetical protein
MSTICNKDNNKKSFSNKKEPSYPSIIIFNKLWIGRRKRIEFNQGILKGGSIAVPLTSCLTGLESAV